MIDADIGIGLAIGVAWRCKLLDGVRSSEALISLSPAAATLRSDHGLEFMAQVRWCSCEAHRNTTTATIEPGYPSEHAFAETFIGQFRHEFLHAELSSITSELQILADDWPMQQRTISAYLLLRGLIHLQAG